MEVQSKYEYYEASEFWADGRSMRVPPEGTVPREQPVGNPGIEPRAALNGAARGHHPRAGGQAAARCWGRRSTPSSARSATACSATATASSRRTWRLRLPPSLLELSGKPAGHFYAAINEGYGVMPSFTRRARHPERWAVVAYVRALQAARGTRQGDAARSSGEPMSSVAAASTYTERPS